jgi:hypothetical protein
MLLLYPRQFLLDANAFGVNLGFLGLEFCHVNSLRDIGIFPPLQGFRTLRQLLLIMAPVAVQGGMLSSCIPLSPLYLGNNQRRIPQHAFHRCPHDRLDN